MIYGTDMGFVAVPAGAEYVQCDEETIGKSPLEALKDSSVDQDIYLVYRFPAEHIDGYVEGAEGLGELFNNSILDSEGGDTEGIMEKLDFEAARKIYVDTLADQLREDPPRYFHVWLVATVNSSGEIVLR